jgi:flagella synthesis protein FlgN
MIDTLTLQLKQQQQHLELLENLLLQEKSIIEQNRAEDLLAVTEQKQQLLSTIEALDNQLSQNEQLPQLKTEPAIAELLQTIQTILQRCKDLNAVNGQLIQHSQLAVERLKNSLLENRQKNSMTYDAKGKTHGGPSSMNIKA